MSSTNSSAPGEQHGLQDWILESVQHYQSYQLAACTALTSFALLLFEYVTTFDREIRYLSDGKRTWAKAVFILNRYISLLQSTATLFCALSSPSLYRSCVILPRIIEASAVLLCAVWTVFSTLRVYAFGGNKAAIAVLVGLLSCVTVIADSVLIGFSYMVKARLPLSPYPEFCTMAFDIPVQWEQKVTLQVAILTLLPLPIAEAIGILAVLVQLRNMVFGPNKPRAMTQLAQRIVREGFYYFVAIMLVNTASVIANFVLDVQFISACAIFNILIPVLVSRFYLNLDDVRSTEGQCERIHQVRLGVECSKTSYAAFKPISPLTERANPNNVNIHYAEEVFRYNQRLLRKSDALV
ncbi:hypothetical protein BD311DRAFT_756864 [Dichomitus squalens]|uniref:DUF6533 domain-containing protein n=1 Tax=Dichomitus squalens TaxID=114155 RepID=A0A4Q9MQH5_9APHY|nr:hypothetical protein BD311DRAFT_756864 [Dichomitus squalens]